MAVTYSTACKNARLDAVAAQIDAGSGAGKLKIRDSGNTVLVTFTLADPCAAAAASGVLTFDCDPALTANVSTGGVANNAIITDSADTTVISGLTVGTSGTNVVIDNTTLVSGGPCRVNSITITHAA